MKLLTVENAKTTKGESLGFLTGILYLAPANESGVMNVCPKASEGCKADCLFTAGRGVFESVRSARIAKTLWLHRDREGFLGQLRKDISALVRRADKLGLVPAVRVNGTSDLAWLALQMASEFPTVQFYDYTKLPKAWLRERSNYHLTFSLSENNLSDALDALEHGVNVAVVFNTKRGEELPASWQGFEVTDGDRHDLRFLDPNANMSPWTVKPVVIGLRAKGRAKKDVHGFVQIAPVAVSAAA